MVATPIKMSDVQGLIMRGYNFPNIRYIILNIKDAEGAKEFCKNLGSKSLPGLSITTAEPWPNNTKPDYCLNIGFTYAGMQQLIGTGNCNAVSFKSSRQVFNAYTGGAVNDASKIGDTGESAPQNWWQNGGWIPENGEKTSDDSNLHIQMTLFTMTPENREKYYAELLAMIPNANGKPSVVPLYFQDSDPLTPDNDAEYVHFGYRDSLSQPRIDQSFWEDSNVKRLMGISSVDDRPIVPADRFLISQAASDYNAHPLLTNGTFAAFRVLYQDEEKFTAFLNSDPNTPPELMAAKICGRWRNGVPLTVSPTTPNFDMGEPGPKNFNFTNFNYEQHSPNQQGDLSSDDLALKCPYAAHIRRANPRDDGNVLGNFDNAQTHRILRRASPYGPKYDPSEKPGIQRGLVGLFIGAVLDAQFRFVTMKWFEQNGFRSPDGSPNASGVDPIFGPQVATPDQKRNTKFAYNKGADYEVIPDMTRFVRTDGSLYLFLPSMTGLSWLSKGEIPPLPSPKTGLHSGLME